MFLQRGGWSLVLLFFWGSAVFLVVIGCIFWVCGLVGLSFAWGGLPMIPRPKDSESDTAKWGEGRMMKGMGNWWWMVVREGL